MQVNISGRKIEITSAIREYTEQKVSKLSRYYDRVASIDVVADKSNNQSPQIELEIIVHVHKSNPFVVKVVSADLYACIDEAVNKLERQLTDHKEKIRNYKHSTPGAE